MRSFLLPALVCALTTIPTAAGLSAQQSETQTPIFRGAARIVPVIATVTDGDGRLVPGLEKEDFSIFDNGKVQETSVFQSSVEPFSVVVMLDKSGSMTANLDRLNLAAEQFILRLLPLDKGQVGAFSDKIQLSGEFTSSRDTLISALKELQFGNPTRLYDAINASMAALTKAEGRKVVLVFTDGDDTSSRLDLGDVLERAKKEEVMVYAIGLQSEVLQRAEHGALTSGPRPEAARRGNRWRLLRTHEDGGPGIHLHTGRAGTPQPGTFSASHPRRSTARNTSSS